MIETLGFDIDSLLSSMSLSSRSIMESEISAQFPSKLKGTILPRKYDYYNRLYSIRFLKMGLRGKEMYLLTNRKLPMTLN